MKGKIDIRQFRLNANDDCWEVPSVDTGLSQGILPLFVGRGDTILPVGTAFTIGELGFLVSATHNIEQAMKNDPALCHLIAKSRPTGKLTFSEGTKLYVLHRRKEADRIEHRFWPLKLIDGASPSDTIFAFRRIVDEFPSSIGQAQTAINRLSFHFPRVGSTILSLGYSDFEYPADGINLASLRTGDTDQLSAYSDRLFAVEAKVTRIFTQGFAKGFLEGPCFGIDSEIQHGMSGGPVYNDQGNVCGINSAGLSQFFDTPASAASVLYPMLARPLRFGAEFGPLTLNASRQMIELIAQGMISTDGSEEEVGFTNEEGSDWPIAHPRVPKADDHAVFEDFAGYQRNENVTPLNGPFYKMKVRKGEEKEDKL